MRDENGCEPDASISMFAYQTANGRPFELFPRYNVRFHQNDALARVPTCTPLRFQSRLPSNQVCTNPFGDSSIRNVVLTKCQRPVGQLT